MRLWYLFWVVPALALTGCATQPQRLVYRPGFRPYQLCTAYPAGAVFDPPSVAWTSAFGQSQYAGINLNSRPVRTATNGLSELESREVYRLRYEDYFTGRRPNASYFSRDFVYYKVGAAQR